MYCEVNILSDVNECQKVHERTFTNGLSALLNLNKVSFPAQFDKHNVLRLNQISGNLKTKANGVERLRSEIESFSSSSCLIGIIGIFASALAEWRIYASVN